MKILKTLLFSFIFLFSQLSSFACDIEVNTTNETIYISGLTSAENTKLFDIDFNVIWECNPWSMSPCSDEVEITNLIMGTEYFLSAESATCQVWIRISLNEEILPSCNDGILNQGETDIDCGGANCVPCEIIAVECQVEVVSQNGGFIINNLTDDSNTKVFDTNFNVAFECNPWSGSLCPPTISIDDLNQGDYFLSVVSAYCEIWMSVSVETTNDDQRCAVELVGYSNDGCFKYNPDGSFSTTSSLGNNIFEEHSFAADGTLVSVNQFEVSPNTSFEFLDNEILELDENGNIINTTSINPAIANIYANEFNFLTRYAQADDLGNFYLIGVSVTQDGEEANINYSLIKLDANGNELASISLYSSLQSLFWFENPPTDQEVNVVGIYTRKDGGVDVYLVEEIAENGSNLRNSFKFEVDPDFNNLTLVNLNWNNISSYLDASLKELEYCESLQIKRESSFFSIYGPDEFTIIDNYDTSSDTPKLLYSTFTNTREFFVCSVSERKTYSINLENGNTLVMESTIDSCAVINQVGNTINISIYDENGQLLHSEDIETFYDQIIPTGGNEFNYIIGNTLYTNDCDELDNDGIQERKRNFSSSGFDTKGVYPNPASDQLFVNINSPSSQHLDLQVYDAVGKLMYEQAYSLDKGSSILSLETSSLPNGIYNLLMVNDANELRTERFVKQ